MLKVLIGVLVVAATATFADWIWDTFEECQGTAAGVLHGAALLTVLGGAIGAASGRLLRGLPIGALAGTGGALAYYGFAALGAGARAAAIPAAWVITWLLMALLEGRWIAAASRSWPAIAARGAAAAVLSGFTFWSVLERLWGAAPPDGRDYALQFAAWCVAWAPGIVVLTLRSGPRA